MSNKKNSPNSSDKQSASNLGEFSIIHPHAAGIDVGGSFHMVAINQNEKEVQQFGVYTEDLHALANYLLSKSIKTVAMESTGFYWKNLFVTLQSYGLEVYLVNGRCSKQLQGQKTDVKDSRWIQKLHSCGLLPNSFQPESDTEELRTYARHRQNLIRQKSRMSNRINKCLVLLNLRLSSVLEDIMGKSGRSIIQAILNGERDGKLLSSLAHGGVKASKEEIEKALVGNWRVPYLFELQQSWDTYHHIKEQITRCDEQTEAVLAYQIEVLGQHDLAYEKKTRPAKNRPKYNLAKYAYQLTDGIDLTEIPGIGVGTVLSIISEVGVHLKDKFLTAGHFRSWLRIVPQNKISGGKLLSSRIPKKKPRLAHSFRQAANSVERMKDGNPITAFFKRIRNRHGRTAAVTATARKLATIVYKMLTDRVDYQPLQNTIYQNKVRKQRLKQVKRTVKQLNLTKEELQAIVA